MTLVVFTVLLVLVIADNAITVWVSWYIIDLLLYIHAHNPTIENEDHHCIWLNNCIGKRNYRTFFTFIVCSTLMCAYVIGFSLAHVITVYYERADGYFLNAIRQEPMSFFDAVFCGFLLFPVGSLTLYHCFLTMKGVTTHEQVSAVII